MEESRIKTHSHYEKWNRITKWSITAFVVGLIGGILADLIDADWTVVPWILFNLATVAGLVMSFVGAPKVFGGLKTGITALIVGAVLFIVGNGMLDQVGSDTVLGVEFTHFSDPLYIIGKPLHTHGILFMIVGGIMALVSYLRRILKAVEGNPTASN